MWLTGRLAPDFKTIADFRKDHGTAIRNVCREFVLLCRRLQLFADGVVAIDGSKFKAVNNRDKNFSNRKIEVRRQQLEHSINRYLAELDRADRQPELVLPERASRLRQKISKIKEQMQFQTDEQRLQNIRGGSLVRPTLARWPSRLGSAVGATTCRQRSTQSTT